MLKFKRATESQFEKVLKSITSYSDISLNDSSIKRLSFESSVYGKGYFSTESYSGMEIFIEQKPKFWIMTLKDRYGNENDKAVAKKFISMKHKFASEKDGDDFVSDIGDAKDMIDFKEIDPNSEDADYLKEHADHICTGDIPF